MSNSTRNRFRRQFQEDVKTIQPTDPPKQWTHRHYDCRTQSNNCYMTKMVYAIAEDRPDVLLKTAHITRHSGALAFGVSCFAIGDE